MRGLLSADVPRQCFTSKSSLALLIECLSPENLLHANPVILQIPMQQKFPHHQQIVL